MEDPCEGGPMSTQRIKDSLQKLRRENEELRARIRELETIESRYHDLYDNAPDMFVSVDPRTTMIKECNKTLLRRTGYARDEVIGMPIFDMYDPSCMDEVQKWFRQFVATGKIRNAELTLRRKDGSPIRVLLDVDAVRDDNGTILYSRSSWRDIEELAEARTEVGRLNRMLNNQVTSLANEMLELANPVIRLFSRIVLLPLVGAIDDTRAERATERLLAAIRDMNAEVVILDVTGISEVDTNVARHLLSAVKSSRLLGAEAIITGIQPRNACTMVRLGLDLQDLRTEGSLVAGIETALALTGRRTTDL